MSEDLEKLQKEIAKRKQDLDELWYKRNAAMILRDDEMERQARLELADTALQNCVLLSRYIRQINDPVANEIDERIKMARQRLDEVRGRRELEILHSWYKEELAPLLNKVEQEGYLVSQMEKKEKQVSA